MKRRNKLLLYSPAFHPIDKLVETGTFKKYQHLDYQKINPLDVVKHNVKLLCDFSRTSSITKFAETGIHKHQYFDYQMTTHVSCFTTHGYLKHSLFSKNN